MEDYQKRVIEELTELDTKRDKLEQFISSEHYDRLSDLEQKRLARQYMYMSLYGDVLEERIDAF